MGEAQTSQMVKSSHKEEESDQEIDSNHSNQNPFAKALSPLMGEKISPSKDHAEYQDHEDDEKRSGKFKDRDIALERVETEKRLALIKAWEENEKSKADNKAHKKLSAIGAWEHTRKSSVETHLKQIEEKLEKKKAEYGEKMKNKIAEIHRQAEEKRAMVEANRGENVLKIEEIAAKYRSTGITPRRLFGCFSC